MFDISFGKLVIVAAVALIVIGPERLPTIAKTAGLLLGRLQRYIAGVKSELRQEMEKAEFSTIEETFQSMQDEVKQAVHDPVMTLQETLDFPKNKREADTSQTAHQEIPDITMARPKPAGIKKEDVPQDIIAEVPVHQRTPTEHHDRR